jgi:hypothetical protein
VPGRGHQLPPCTRRFRLGFALLRGGSRIRYHRAGVLSLTGMFTCAFRPHAPYRAGLGASECSQDYPLLLIPLLGPPATPTRCLSPCMFPPGLPSCSQAVETVAENGGRSQPRRNPSVLSQTAMVCHFFRDGLGEDRRRNRHTMRIGRNPQFVTSLWNQTFG